MKKRFVTFILALTASACAGSKGPPPRVAEVPIDDVPGSLKAVPIVGAGNGADATEASNVGALGGGGGSAGGGGGGGGAAGAAAALGGGGGGAGGLLPAMTAMGAGGGAGAPGSGKTKPLPPKAERLSADECNKVMDKYIELVGLSQGITADAIGGVMSMLRNSVANDPNYSGALGACARENTKTQYRCAMRATDVDGWNKCLK